MLYRARNKGIPGVRDRQPILQPDSPVSISGFPSDNQSKIDQLYKNIQIVSMHGTLTL